MTTMAERILKVQECKEAWFSSGLALGSDEFQAMCEAIAELPDQKELSCMAPMVLASDYDELKAELEELQGWKLAWESGGQPAVDKILDERNEMKQRARELEQQRDELAAALKEAIGWGEQAANMLIAEWGADKDAEAILLRVDMFRAMLPRDGKAE